MDSRLAPRAQRIRPSATVSITARAARLRAQGRDVISLSAGEPDFDTPEHVKAAAIAAIQRGDTKYTPVDGTRALKEAVAEKFRRENSLEYTPAQILVSAGAKQCCFNACLVALQQGDEAIIPAPYWVSYPDMVRVADAEPVIVHTTADRGFRMTPAQLDAAITPQTRMLILNSPCNPTGAVYSREDWVALGEVLREHPKVLVLADDIYEHIHWGNAAFSSMAQACPFLHERTLTVNGASKAYAMTGWRIGYAGGPDWLIGAMSSLQSQSTTNASSISQAAALAALLGGLDEVGDRCAEFKKRHDYVMARLEEIDGVECRPGGGTFYAFPKVEAAARKKGLADDVELCEHLLEHAGVALVPGTAFGAPGYLRMSFAAGRDVLSTALDRIAVYLNG